MNDDRAGEKTKNARMASSNTNNVFNQKPPALTAAQVFQEQARPRTGNRSRLVLWLVPPVTVVMMMMMIRCNHVQDLSVPSVDHGWPSGMDTSDFHVRGAGNGGTNRVEAVQGYGSRL